MQVTEENGQTLWEEISIGCPLLMAAMASLPGMLDEAEGFEGLRECIDHYATPVSCDIARQDVR
jgi:hypothetical protein